MKVFSSRTNGEWLADTPVDTEAEGTEAKATSEAKRVLSDILHCNNLIVLSGLGTSLCVEPIEPGGLRAPTMWNLWVNVETIQNTPPPPDSEYKPNFDEILRLVGHQEGSTDIEALLSRCKLAESFFNDERKNQIAAFISLAEREISRATSFIKTDHPLPVHNEFLRRVARRSQRKPRTKIFTTNYDRCFEEAGRQGRYVVVDGFSHTMPPTFDAIHFTYETVRKTNETGSFDPIPNSFHLYKLHGSIDWRRQTPSGAITKWDDTGSPVLIYPRNSKYELAFEQPYLEMISSFQSALREPDTALLVIGFGFNDNHLAEPIMSAIRSNLSLKVVVVSPRLSPDTAPGSAHEGECLTNRYLSRIYSLSNSGDARLSLINSDFQNMVTLIPDLVAETDLERHIERLNSIGES